MKLTRKTYVITLLIALAACSSKAQDNCKQHTGDGLCAGGSAANGAS